MGKTVSVGSLSNVLFSRVPEGPNTDPRPQLERTRLKLETTSL